MGEQSQTTTQQMAQNANQHKPAPGVTAPNQSDAPSAAATETKQEQPPNAQETIEDVHAPPIGTRIQVLWRIVHGETNNNANGAEAMDTDTATGAATGTGTGTGTGNEGETGATAPADNVEERWWGAVVQERTTEKVGDRSTEAVKNLDVHILLYDAYGEFDEEVVRVAFLPDRSLLDLSMLDDPDGGKLDWRLESEAMNDDDDDANPVRSLECVAREAEQICEMSGIAADADLQALSRMPHEVQLHVASAYRSFADSVKDMLGELIASKPSGYVVTAQDVQEIMARVRAQRQQQSGALTGTAAQ